MATLLEIERIVSDGLMAVTSKAVLEVTSLRAKYPQAFTDDEHEMLARVEVGQLKMESELRRLRDRLNAVIARGSGAHEGSAGWGQSI